MRKEEITRCEWIKGKPDYYVEYHDNVWGKPEYNDQELFKWLSLEIFHIGLSWQLVLSKYENFIDAFDGFEVQKVAVYGDNKIEELMEDEGIIRYRRKIEATINNAKRFLDIQDEFGSFSDYIWGFSNHEQVVKMFDEHLTKSDLSDQVTEDFKKRGFKFIGSVTMYSFLQAIGIINDHDLDCDFR
ncbi:MAG TPA: DNA-3-methyladenine glycosylase I [Atopostipes sp.]|nr:DNA-3-methyladenine glycosylase I [Atopostipes sp.]